MKFFRLLNYIIRKKIKIKFNRLQHNDILVFDGVSKPDLEFLLEEFNYMVLENRFERIKEVNLSPETIFRLIGNFLNLILKRKRLNLSNLYFYTFIKLIKPKVVITSIDNSSQFHQLAKLLHDEIVFFAIQNANRLDYLNNEYNMRNSLSKIDYNSKVGKHSIINTNSSIDHDCEIKDYVNISPGVNIAGSVIINDLCKIGIGSNIMDKIKIQKNVTIGGGSFVNKDCTKNLTYMGLPAKIYTRN